MTSLADSRGVTTTTYVLVVGVVVVVILGFMLTVRGGLQQTGQGVMRCLGGAVQGNFSACGGGGSATTSAQAQAGGDRAGGIPGSRSGGLYGGLVSQPGGAGSGGAGSAGSDGAAGGASAGGAGGGRGNVADGAAGAGGGGGGRGGAGGSGATTPSPLQQLKDRHNRFIRRVTQGGGGPESWRESAARTWSALSPASWGTGLNAAQRELERQGDYAWGRGWQYTRNAGKKLQAGDVAGYNAEIRKAQRWFNQASTSYHGAESSKADMADNAMGESAAIFQTSSEALAATANPTGYLTGKAVGYGVSTLADATLPDGRVKQVVVVVGTALGSAYAGGMTPQTWSNMGANAALTTGQQAAFTYGQMAASAVVTQQTKGTNEAMWEVGLGLGTQALMQSKVFPPGGGGSGTQRRNLGEVLAQTPSATAVRSYLDDNVVPALNIDVRSVINRVTGNTPEGAAVSGAQQAQHHTPRDTQADEPRSMPAADDGFLDRLANTPEPELSPQQRAAAEAAGIDPRIAAKLWRAAQASGESDMYRTTALEATQQIADGAAVGKPLGIKGKSNPTNRGRIHKDAMQSKLGAKLEQAQAAYDNARQTNDYDNLPQARRNLVDAKKAVRAGNKKNSDAVQKGVAKLGADELTGDTILVDPETGRPFVADIDKFTSTATDPNEVVGNYGERGFGTPTELQHLANKRTVLGDDASALQHSMEARNPNPLDLEDSIFLVTPEGGPQVINGKENIVRAVREHGMVENPLWHQQAGIEPPPAPVDQARQVVRRNPAVTQQQVNLEITRTQSRVQYDQDAQRAVQHYGANLGGIELGRPRGQSEAPDQDRQARLVRQGASSDAARTRQVRGELVQASRAFRTAADSGSGDRVRQADGSLQTVLRRRATSRARVDDLVKRTFGLTADAGPSPIAGGWPADSLWRALAAPVSLAGFLGIPQAPSAAPPAEQEAEAEPILQSAVHERVHAYASPAWRGDLEVYTPLHEGVVEQFTQQVMAVASRSGAAVVSPFPAFGAEVAAARRLSLIVGEDVLRLAYFEGDVAGLFGQIGIALGVDLAQAEAAGRGFVHQLGLELNQGQFGDAGAALGRVQPSGSSRSPETMP